MDKEAVRTRLERVFRDFFDDSSIALSDETTARDIKGWDSIVHVTLIAAVERHFGVRLTTRQILGLNTVGDLARLLEDKLGGREA